MILYLTNFLIEILTSINNLLIILIIYELHFLFIFKILIYFFLILFQSKNIFLVINHIKSKILIMLVSYIHFNELILTLVQIVWVKDHMFKYNLLNNFINVFIKN